MGIFCRSTKTWSFFAGSLILGVLLVETGYAQSSSGTLPPGAQEAMARGLAAARLQEWPLAIKYFTEARKAAPKAPQVIFNLALACDKAGGRELSAIALYRAYLAADPGANNAAQVQSQIVQLEVKAEADITKLIQKVKEMSASLPEGTIYPSRSSIYHTMASAEMGLGLFEEAERSASITEEFRDRNYVSIFEARVKAYDLEGALKTLSRLHDTEGNFFRYESVLRAMLRTEQFQRAKELAERMKEIAEGMRDENKKASAYESVIHALLGAGDPAGAVGVMAKVPVSARPAAYGSISQELLKTGDLSGAIEAAAKAPEKDRIWIMLEIAKAQSKGGDTSGVAKTLGLCIEAVQGIGNESDRLAALANISRRPG